MQSRYQRMRALAARTVTVLSPLLLLPAAAVQAQVSFDFAAFPTASSADSLARLDFDGDGLEDIAVAQGWWIEILRNRGDGDYERAWAFDAGNVNLCGLGAIDLDGDRFMDLVWGARGYLFGSDPDLHILRNQGAQVFTHTVYPVDNRLRDIAPADMDGDGDDDLVALDSGGGQDIEEIHTWINENGTFIDSDAVVLGLDNVSAELALGDFDQDGDVDVAAATASARYSDTCVCDVVGGASVWILDNDGAAHLSIDSDIHLPDAGFDDGYFPSGIRSGDLDGDGDLDLAATIGPYAITNDSGVVLLENTNGQFTIVELPRIAGTLAHPKLDLADVDLDGRLDVFLATGRRNQVGEIGLYLNEGDWQFSDRQIVGASAGAFPHELRTASLGEAGQMGFVVGDDWGVSLFTNTTPIVGPRLSVSSLRRGQPAAIRVNGAAPGEPVHVLYSLDGYGPSLGIALLGGLCIDLAGNVSLLATARADGDGTATWNGKVPENAPQRTVYMQAVIQRGPGGVRSVKTPIAHDLIAP